MTWSQAYVFALLGTLVAFLVWGRFRYDLVAFGALILAVIGGVVPAHDAFLGFGNEAVIIIALVLAISRALLKAGAVEAIARFVVSADRPLPVHIAVMAAAGAMLSAVINNVAALVILMSLDIEAAEKAKRSVSLSLMPLSFATILGGMVTLIGTPPNIVISGFRAGELGEPFQMFDFTPVGLVVAVAGILFVSLLGWRLLPERAPVGKGGRAIVDVFLAEAKVPEKSPAIGRTPADLAATAEDQDVAILGLVRRGQRFPGFAQNEPLRKGDFLVVEGAPKAIEAFVGSVGLTYAGAEKHGGLAGGALSLMEAIVPDNARAVGRSADSLKLYSRRGITLLGVSRSGVRFRERVRKLPLAAGDVLLLLGPASRLDDTADWLGVLAIEQGRHDVIQRNKALAAIAIFLGAVGLSVAGIVPLAIALALAIVFYVLFGILGGREIYEAVEWPVIVLLGSLIPIGGALESTGGTALIANGIAAASSGLPAWAVLGLVMMVTMTLSDFLNNVATAIIAAPVALGIAERLGVSPDPFLMGVAVASSCAFLTPIGHKNNTIIMGPGRYRFGDYWRMGLPLEVLVLAVALPAILWFWPL
jgi:di/tricarboxylate transporter